uniref:STAS domain-containing protein n=2 Tax=Corethron hystrix TaxID=216773 RepID=A0A7S1BEV7_9STRA
MRAGISFLLLSAASADSVLGFGVPSSSAVRGGGFLRPLRSLANRPSQVEDVVANSKSIGILGDLDAAKVVPATAAGAAVALAMVPEAVAFSFVAGVNPLVGLWTTVTLGFVAAAFGGRAGICSSASGACAVVVAALCRSHGPAYLSGCAMLAGLLQAGAGLLGAGKFIRLVPHPVMLGFVNGLALVMTRAQMGSFKDAATGAFLRVTDPVGAGTYGIAALTMLLVRYVFPKIKNKFVKKVPPTLGAVAVASVVARLCKLPVQTLADVAGAETFRGGLAVLPKLAWPAVPAADYLGVIFPYALTMAAVGCIESLLTMQLVDGIVDDGTRGSTRRECIGQGLGNVASGLAGGIGGCALLGQSLINVESGGGASRLSGMSMALLLGLGIVGAAPLLGAVPVPALTGVMLLVCQSTFSWSSLRIINKIPRVDAAVILLVSAVTVVEDLAKAVLVGTVACALSFAWKQSTSITASSTDNVKARTKTYSLRGPLFFGSSGQFAQLFSPKADPDDVVVDFSESRIMDHSGLEAVNELADRYGAAGKRVTLRGLSSDCAGLLSKLHEGGLPPYEIIAADPASDPVYEVAEDSKYYKDIPVPKPV